eukprot:scaffold15948_cov43-Cyclotella_meneghiniana.AAC.2
MTTLCEGDVRAALVEFLQAMSRNSSASVSNSTDGGYQHLNKIILCISTTTMKQQETHPIRDRIHFVLPGHLPIRLQYHPDRTSISEGDVVLFDRASFRNLRQSSLLVISKMQLQMDLQNKNNRTTYESNQMQDCLYCYLLFTLISSIPVTIVSEGDLLHLLLYGFGTELAVMMHVKLHHDVLLLKVQNQR